MNFRINSKDKIGSNFGVFMDILFLSVFGLIGLVYLFLGLFYSKGIKTNEDYFLAGRKLSFFPLAFTLIATQVGGGMMLGTAAESYKVGYFGIFYTLGMSLGFLILGLGVASKLRSFNVVTTAQLFESKYNSVFLRKVASLISIVTLFGLLCAQVVASRSVLLALGFSNDFVLIAFWLIVIFYTMIGGLRAVAATDTAQILFLLTVFSVLFIKTLLAEPSSFFTFSSFVSRQGAFNSSNFSFLTLFPVIFNPMMFSLIEQDLAQRFFSARTKRIAALGAVTASAFLLLFSFIPVYFGMKANLTSLFLPEGANPLIVTIKSVANRFFLSLIVTSIAAAVISTADSLLCAISSNICQDFDFSFIKIKKVNFSKMVTLVVGLLAILVAYFSNDIIGLLVQSYELSISCLFVPFIFSYFKKSLNKNAAALSILLGLFGFFIFRLVYLPFPKELSSIILSLLGYFIGDKFLKK
ncbi:sodium:solute symporter family protein [Candidatus Dependentiae bacterium]|nr:sodium:solute symporter family protein [Candidatus Dependentiae bacterium]